MSVEVRESEILAVLRAESEAFFRGDFDAFASYWVHGPEAWRSNSGPHIRTTFSRGWNEVSVRMREGMRNQPQHFKAEECVRWENIQIHAGEDMAWVTHDSVAIRLPVGIAASAFQHELKILRRVDGAWKLAYIAIVVPGFGRNDVPQIEIGLDLRVVRVNMPAEERLENHPGLGISAGRVHARQKRYDAVLQHELSLAAVRTVRSLGIGSPGPIVAPVPLGEDDFGHRLYCWVTSEHNRLLLTFDDGSMIGGRLDLAGELFGLSPAQLKVAKLLVTGRNLSDTAEEMAITVNTVRTQVRRMFEKTGTHNQTELISTLMSVQRPD